jgi:hypothetical protein
MSAVGSAIPERSPPARPRAGPLRREVRPRPAFVAGRENKLFWRLAAYSHRGVVKYPAELTTPKRLGHGSWIGSGQTGVPPSPRINHRPSDGDAEEDERGGFGDRCREHSELQGVDLNNPAVYGLEIEGLAAR